MKMQKGARPLNPPNKFRSLPAKEPLLHFGQIYIFVYDRLKKIKRSVGFAMSFSAYCY